MPMRKLRLGWGVTRLRVFGFASDPRLSSEQIHCVRGDPARVNRAWTAEQDLEVVTWNIEQGLAFDAILSVLRRLNADVVLLQEVDSDCRRTHYKDVAKDLAEALDMNWVAVGEFQELGEARRGAPAITGQAILSKFAIDEAKGLRFKAQDRWRWSINPVQPRRGGRIALKVRIGGVTFYNTHIESGGNEQLRHRQMAEIVADQAGHPGEESVVIAGDFNNRSAVRSLTLHSLTSASFVDALGDDAAGRGATSLGQAHPIDWIFAKHLAASGGRVVADSAASDHSPVMAAFAAVAPGGLP